MPVEGTDPSKLVSNYAGVPANSDARNDRGKGKLTSRCSLADTGISVSTAPPFYQQRGNGRRSASRYEHQMH